MSPEAQISELVARVRDRAASEETGHVRDAFAAELARVHRAHSRRSGDWSAWGNGADVVGTAYEELLSGAERRAAGQFQTPTWAADLMASWLLQRPSELLLDPGVGAGRLLFRAAERHPDAIGRLAGIDTDPVSLAMARLNLRLRGIEDFALRDADFLLGYPFRERPDALTCNPPYSRHHTIPAGQKAAIHAGFEDRLGLRLSRLAGLHVLFLVRALELVREGGRLAFITPAEWLDVNYGREVKRFVLERARVESIVLWKPDHLVFEGALTTAAITLLRVGTTGSATTTVVRMPSKLPQVEDALRAIEGAKGGMRTEEVELTAADRWSRPPRRRVPKRGRPLGEVARIRRGIATGCNRFFVISEERRQERGLEVSDLLPCIATPRLVSGSELTAADLERLPADAPRWLLAHSGPGATTGDDALGRYLRWGRRTLRAHAGYLASQRKPWYGPERRHDPAILFTYMNRKQARFIRNRAGAAPLNTFLVLEPIEVDPDELWAALQGDAVARQLSGARRNYGGGLWKLEPRELGGIKVGI